MFFPTIVSLIAKLEKREPYAALLNCDPRPTIDIIVKAYLHSVRKVVNPEGKDKSVIYGCSGADSMSVLLATDANDLTFVDLTPIHYDHFEMALQQLRNKDPNVRSHIIEYLQERNRQGGGVSKYDDGLHSMDNLALKLLFDLYNVGVPLARIVLTRRETGVQIEFPGVSWNPWAPNEKLDARNSRHHKSRNLSPSFAKQAETGH